MISKMYFILLLLFSLSALQLGAQDLHIYYDAHSKNLTYTSKGDTIYSPRVKRGSQVFLHVDNFNNFLYEVELEADQETLSSSSSGGGVASLLQGGAGGLQSLLGGSGLMGIPPVAKTGMDNSGDGDFDLSGYGANTESMQQLAQLQNQYQQSLTQMFKAEKQIGFIAEDVNGYVEAQAISGVVQSELENLKRNPRLQPGQIRSLTLEYLHKIFQTDNPSDINLSSLLEKSNAKKELTGYLQKLNVESSIYESGSNKIRNISAQIALLNLAGGGFQAFENQVTEVADASQKVILTIDQNKTQLQELIANARTEDIQNLSALRYEYEAIAANDFSETFRVTAEGDATILQLTFTEKPLDGAPAGKAFTIPEIKVPVFGNLKINASVGFSFGVPSKRPQAYFIRDSIIVGEDGDRFLPMITSFFHFYSQGAGQISIGGSLGVGIPLIGGGSTQSISFLAGPSLIIGKGQRLVISGGVMGSKVERISKGYQTGDVFPNFQVDIPTKSVYELGYFMGLSFNVGASN